MAQESYKTLKDKLDVLIAKLQDPSIDLDEALKLHKEGKKLIVQLENYLKDVEQKVAKATKDG